MVIQHLSCDWTSTFWSKELRRSRRAATRLCPTDFALLCKFVLCLSILGWITSGPNLCSTSLISLTTQSTFTVQANVHWLTLVRRRGPPAVNILMCTHKPLTLGAMQELRPSAFQLLDWVNHIVAILLFFSNFPSLVCDTFIWKKLKVNLCFLNARFT